MNSSARFRINAPTVISETIDTETIIINLDTGVYYSLRHTGAVIWQLIEQGLAGQALVDELAKRYVGTPAAIQVGLQSLLAELMQDQLIVPLDDEHAALQPAPTAPTAHYTQQPFIPPVLEKYTDMADLLLLDPIHEVSEQGWPTPKRAG